MLDLKINTVIIESDQKKLKELQSLLKKTIFFSIVGTATNGKRGFSLITNLAPQVVFIDVDLQDINGLEFVRILHNRNIFPEIVFVADNTNLAFDSLPLEPLDFLERPFQKEIIFNLIKRLKSKLKKNELMRKMEIFTKSHSVSPKRTFKQKSGIIIVEIEEIVFVKASLTNSVLTLRNGDETVLKNNLNQTCETIHSDDFIRINRSYCINRNYLQKIDKQNLNCFLQYGKNTWEVPASKNTIRLLEKLNVFSSY